jgi:hypothetical protein
MLRPRHIRHYPPIHLRRERAAITPVEKALQSRRISLTSAFRVGD